MPSSVSGELKYYVCCKLGFLSNFTTLAPNHIVPAMPSSVTGELKDYVCSELNVRVLETCSDQLKYATLRAEPDWQALGKRLGKALASECGELWEGVNSVGVAAGWRPSLTGRHWARGWARHLLCQAGHLFRAGIHVCLGLSACLTCSSPPCRALQTLPRR